MTTETKEKAQLYAKLVRGNQYVYRPLGSEKGATARVFVKGKWEPVDIATREHLILNAVDYVTVSGGGEDGSSREERQKFVFREGPPDENEDEKEAGSAPRTRRRTR